MYKKSLIILGTLIIIFIPFIKIYLNLRGIRKMVYKVSNLNELRDLFPKSVEQILYNKQKCIEDIDEHLKKILAIPIEKRTFDNTARALDEIYYFYHPINSSFHALELLSPDKDIRECAQQEALALSNYVIDKISTNVNLYQVFKEYAEKIAPKENLNEVEKFFIEESLNDFKRSGLDLPPDKLEKVRELTKEITALSLQFEANISQDVCNIAVPMKDLDGLSKEYIDSLKKTPEGNYLLGCDYPTYFNVMDNCKVESTRKTLCLKFLNRAYPKNVQLLEELISKRTQLANLLGFESYAHLTLDSQMAKNPSTVHNFLNNLLEKASLKAKKEAEIIKADLPDSVKLTNDGKIKPWDSRFIKNYYKKKYLNLDEQKISEYFSMEHTVKQLLYIYEKFLSIKFKEVPIAGLWDKDIKLVEVYDANDNLRGYLLLDLFPRDNKYTHAAHTTIVSCINDKKSGNINPVVGIVIANFPKPTADKPSLLKFNDVKTFFHEFGHAIHALLGCTEFYSFSGTNVKRDFVEMPSQMLEDWLKDKEIMKLVSKHYKTGETLPDNLIDTIIKLEKFDSGDFVSMQIYYALLSLSYFEKHEKVDTQEISKTLYNKILKHLAWQPETCIQASFGHLTGYGPSYYGYLWSKVFAKDLFNEIKKHGLLNPEIGKKYIDNVIGMGGSKDPNELIRNFLGRDPDEQAFMKDFDFI